MPISVLIRKATTVDARMVLMHGLGSDERDMAGLAEEFLPSIEVACLRAPHAYGPGYAWFDIDWTPDGIRIDEDQYWNSVDMVASILPQLGSDLIVGGFSQGSMMALGLVVRYPHLVKHAVFLSGRGLGVTPGPNFHGYAFQGHGLADPVIPFRDAEGLRTDLGPLGDRFEFHAYPMGHTICPEEIDHLNAWFTRRLSDLA